MADTKTVDIGSLPPLTAPPSYATTDPASSEPSRLPAYETRRQPSPLPIHKTCPIVKSTASGFDVLPSKSKNADPIYHINRPGTGVYLYRGSDNRSPRLAQARLNLGSSRRMDIYIGNSREPAEQDWEVVRYSKESHGFLKRATEIWRFDVREPGPAGGIKRKLAWHSTHGNFALRDEETDVVLADHADKSLMGDCGYGSTLGTTAWKEACSQEVEVAALVTLMAILERRRGGARQVGKALGSQVGNGFGPTTVAM